MRAGETAVRFINRLDLWHRRLNPRPSPPQSQTRRDPMVARCSRARIPSAAAFSQPPLSAAARSMRKPHGHESRWTRTRSAARQPRADLNFSATQRCDTHANAATSDQPLLETTRTMLETRTTRRRPTPRETVEHQANPRPLPARGRGQPQYSALGGKALPFAP